jgi:hypothetical protein
MAVENQTLAPFYSDQRNPYNYAKFEQVARDVTTQWLTLDEITNQLNLFDDTSQDSYLQTLDLATRMAIEDYLGASILPITWKVYYTNFGLYNTSLFLDLPQVQNPNLVGQTASIVINEVAFYSTSNTVPVVIDSSQYSYDPTGNRVILATIPNTLNQQVANPVMVTYTQNSAFLGSYPVIKQAGLMLLTHIYNNRSNTTDTLLREVPFGVASLLRPYKPLVM